MSRCSTQFNNGVTSRAVQKTKIRFRFGYKKIRTVQKFDIRADGFPTETVQFAVQIKSDKNNFTYIQCVVLKVKMQVKPNLAYRF